MNKIENSKKEAEVKTVAVNTAISSDEEAVLNYFLNIQKNFNLNLNEKLKWNINVLLGMQTNMKITYVIIKKIDFKDDFLEKYNLNTGLGEPNLSEIFAKMSKINLLNVYQLRDCGPILIFRLLTETKFSEIKEACCKHWVI